MDIESRRIKARLELLETVARQLLDLAHDQNRSNEDIGRILREDIAPMLDAANKITRRSKP